MSCNIYWQRKEPITRQNFLLQEATPLENEASRYTVIHAIDLSQVGQIGVARAWNGSSKIGSPDSLTTVSNHQSSLTLESLLPILLEAASKSQTVFNAIKSSQLSLTKGLHQERTFDVQDKLQGSYRVKQMHLQVHLGEELGYAHIEVFKPESLPDQAFRVYQVTFNFERDAINDRAWLTCSTAVDRQRLALTSSELAEQRGKAVGKSLLSSSLNWTLEGKK